MGFAALSRVKSVGLLAGAAMPIAIDFGVGSLKVLQIAQGQPPTLLAAACVETPDDIAADHPVRLSFQADALARLVKSAGFKGRRAVCSIPSAQMFCKHMQFNKPEGADVAALVEAAIPAQLGCSPHAVVWRHIVVADAGSKAEVICLAVPREFIARVMEILKACRLEPVGIHPACLAALRSFDLAASKPDEQAAPTLVLDVGYGATTCMISHGRNLVFAKSIFVGGRHFDETIVRQLKCSIAWARSQRLVAEQLTPAPVPAGAPAPGSSETAPPAPPAPPVPSAPKFNLAEPLETLTDEIAMCLRYHESAFPGKRVARLVFVGGEARHRALCQYIARALRLPAQVADPLANLARTGIEPCSGLDLSTPQPGWAVAFGLSLSPTDL